MKAVRLHRYDERPTLDEIDDPKITSPHDVIIKIGGADDPYADPPPQSTTSPLV